MKKIKNINYYKHDLILLVFFHDLWDIQISNEKIN